MGQIRRASVLQDLRRDRIAGAWLAIVLLFLPFLQPLAEAKAAGKPFAAVICSSYGVSGNAVFPGLADDCPACVVGHHVPLFSVPAATAECVLPLAGAEPADFPSPLSRPLAASPWKLKPPGQAPPFSV